MIQNDADVYSPPAPRKLAEIMKHVAYHAHYDGLGRLDAGTDAATITAAGGRDGGTAASAIFHREQTRLVSRAQPLAEHALADPREVPEEQFLAALQFNTGLWLSNLLPANQKLVAAGEEPDWLGDGNWREGTARGEKGVRHDDGNAAIVNALNDAMPTRAVIPAKGRWDDVAARRQAEANYADVNAGHVPDWLARGAAPAGKHIVGEHKCVTPHVQASQGRGSRGGSGMQVGHKYALGNTEEDLVRKNLGFAERGLGSGRKFRHETGLGYAPRVPGCYADALAKRHQVVLTILEVYGGANRALASLLGRLTDRVSGDEQLTYVDAIGREVSYRTYHARALASSAVYGTASMLLKYGHALARRTGLAGGGNRAGWERRMGAARARAGTGERAPVQRMSWGLALDHAAGGRAARY